MNRLLSVFSLVAALFPLFQSTAPAQEAVDVIYLKNGSVIKGSIVEQVQNVYLKIGIRDGSIYVYKMEEIEKIVKEKETPPPGQTPPMQIQSRPHKSPGLALGLSLLIIPGSGQWYNGDTGKGFRFFVMGIGGWGLMVAGLFESTRDFGEYAFMAGALFHLTSRIWGGIDAYKSAKRKNTEGGYTIYRDKKPGKSLSISFDPAINPSGDVVGMLGLRMNF